MEFSISIPQVLVEPQFGRQLFAFLNAAGNLRYLIVQKLLRQNQLNCPTKSHKCIQHTTQQAPQISQPELHITLEQFEGEFLHLGAANSYSIFVNIRQNSWKNSLGFVCQCSRMFTNVTFFEELILHMLQATYIESDLSNHFSCCQRV